MHLDMLNSLLNYLPNLLKSQQGQSVLVRPVGKMATSPFIRLAGISGAVAVGLGAYGSHVVLNSNEIPKPRKRSFKTASKYHLVHTLALMATPYAKYSKLSAALLIGGVLLFCGPCYHFSITGNEKFKFITPYGGVLLIAAWLSFAL